MATSSSAGPPSSGSAATAQQPQSQYLVLAVEATAALGPSWSLLRSEYLDKIARAFYGQDGNVQKDNGSTLEMALVVFRSHDSYSGCLFQRSGWTPSLELFQLWLSSIDFSGGGFGEVAVAEGLAEALVMCCPTTQPPSNQACQRHCILVAASNPHRLQTPVPHPPISTGGDGKPDHWWLADAETVAKAFSQCHISLSVVCPRQLPSLKNLYSVAKQNPRASDPSNEIAKHSQHLVLISESFLEARNCLRRVTQAPALSAVSVPPSPTSVKVEQQAAAPLTMQTTQPGPATAVPTVSTGPAPTTSGRQTQIMSNGNIPTSTVKMEHVSTSGTLSYGSPPMVTTSMAAVPLPIHSSGTTSAMSQDVLRPPLGSDSTTTAQDFKSINTNPLQSHRPVPAASVLNQIRQGAGSAAVSSILSAGSLSVGQVGMGLTQPASQPAGVAHGLTADVGAAGLGPVQNANAASNILPSNAPAAMMQPTAMPSGLPPVATTVGMAQTLQAASPLVVGGQSVQGAGLGMPHSSIAAPSNSVGSGPNAGVMLPMAQPGQNPAASNGGVSHLVSNGVATTPPQQQPGNAKYTKLWQGTLAGQRHGKPVPICSLEGYRQISSPETLAADWPLTMQIVRLIQQDYMSNREYQGKAELLVFRPLNQHGFLLQLAEKKLCAVIQLPSQTLLLASADKPQRMIGMLFPGDMVVFKQQSQNPQPAASNFSHGGFPQAGQQSKPPQMMPGGSQMPMAGSGGTQIPGQGYLL